MSLQFIFGNSGSGKSTYLYQQVLEEAGKNPDKNYLVLVPEQFTMSTQRELVRLQKAHAIMNVDVLSFARLAYRVFDELGQENLMVLEETGKNLVLRKIAEEKKADLKILGGNMNKMGYVGEVKSLISELSQYNITPDVLQEFLSCSDISETLHMKLQDVWTLYEGFRNFLEGKFITSEEILTLLCEVTEDSAIIRDSVIVFDEFTGFTPIQNNLIAKLLTVAEKLIVSVTMDAREDFYHSRGDHELFAMSKKTVKALLDMADKLHVQVEEPVVLSKGWRYVQADRIDVQGAMLTWTRELDDQANKSALYFMEQNLFRPWNKKWQNATDEIQIYLHRNPKEEIVYVASKIAALVRKAQYHYADIAVVTGDVNLYSNYVAEAFAQYGIPFFVDQTKNILYHPLIEFVRAALEVIETGFSYESIFRFLRCGLCGISEDQIDILENYVLAKGIRGIKKWKSTWTFVRNGEVDELLELNQIRGQVVTLLLPLYQIFAEECVQVKAVAKVLYDLLWNLEIEEQMKEKEHLYEEAGDFAKAKEYSQIYRILMDLLDKVVALLGEEKITIGEFADVMDAGFDAAKVAVIPPGKDKVTIGDIERTRLQHIKVLFFVGVNDGIVPKSENKGGIISQFERELLSESKMELAPGARQRVFIQKFYLYLNMTKPSDRLYITFSKVNAEGKALRPSYLVGTIQKLFPQLSVTEVSQLRPSEQILTPESGMEFFLQGLQEKTETEFWNALTHWYLKDERFREQVQKLLDAAYDSYSEEPISHAVTKALYGTTLENSVTRLERFASCAFAHYLQYGLGLKERELLQFASVDMGNIYHEVLEHFSKLVEASEYGWFDMPEEVANQFIEEAMEEIVAGYKGAEAFEDSKNRYLLSRMKHTLYCTVWALIHQVKKGRFVPSEFEVSFSGYSDFNAIRFHLSEEEKMNLRGRIDRVDTYEEDDKVYVRIIDYKSGNTSFSLLNLYHGLQLQLVVYMNAAMELVAKKHPDKQIEPAGIFYYNVKHPMIEGIGNESDEEIRKALLEQLKLNGLVNEKPEVYRGMDTELGSSSSVIPVGLKTDGSLRATSKVASAEEFSVISEYVNQKIIETGQRIFAGDVAMEPYQLEKRSGCDYCPYHAVCGFDTRLPGHSYRKLEAIDDSETVMEKMRG